MMHEKRLNDQYMNLSLHIASGQAGLFTFSMATFEKEEKQLYSALKLTLCRILFICVGGYPSAEMQSV